ncbi:MAG: acylphosphatase [Thiohalocapsa sp.]
MSESAERGVAQVCVLCQVTGHVQGVFFRASAREEALRLGLTGYARNLPDGRVEVLVCGGADAVGELREWLRRGPPQADVTGVACEPTEFRSLSGFAAN